MKERIHFENDLVKQSETSNLERLQTPFRKNLKRASNYQKIKQNNDIDGQDFEYVLINKRTVGMTN